MKYQKYSVSKINAFKQCKKLFKFKYIDKLKPSIKSIDFQKGDLLHKLIECSILKNKKLEKSEIWNYKSKYDFSDEKFSEYCQVYENFYSSNIIKVIKSLPYKKYVENWINFNSKLEPIDNQTISMFTGKIDYYVIDKDKNIALSIDWKTGGKNADAFPLSKYQLDVYSIWILQKYKLKGVKSKYYYIENNKEVEHIVLEKDVNRIKNTILSDINEIEKCSSFDSSISNLCDYCEYYCECNE